MSGGSGIELYTPSVTGTGTDNGFSASGEENFGIASFFNDTDLANFNVDLGAGETLTISGDFGSSVPVSSTGVPFSVSNAPGFGSFSFDTTSGQFSYTITRTQLDANGGNQTIAFQVTGMGAQNYGVPATLDTDTVQITVTCFAKGTGIATHKGETVVEALQIGDRLRTHQGRDVVVKWIGKQRVSPRFAPAERRMPVRFAAGSLGAGLPHRDLTVAADHAILVDGILCNASALVNGTTITRVPLDQMGDTYEVYHIETEAHEIILANGAPAETFIDNISRRVFDNFAEYIALYGDEREMQELPLPRAQSARQVPAPTRNRLAGQRAA